jgi:large subunit ribosomal protein L25
MKKPNIVEIEATTRESRGSKNNELRDSNQIPAVIYGPKIKENICISIDEIQLEKLLRVQEKEIVRLKIGKNSYDCTLKQTDFHPVTDRPIHADFYALDKDTPFTFIIPLRLSGTAVGTTEGGRMYQPLREIKVKCLPEFIPAEFVVNIEKLKIGQTLKVRRLKADNMEIITPGSNTIVVIRPPKGATVSITEADEDEEEGATAEEPAVEAETAE